MNLTSVTAVNLSHSTDCDSSVEINRLTTKRGMINLLIQLSYLTDSLMWMRPSWRGTCSSLPSNSIIYLNRPQHDKTNKMTYVPSEDSNQHAYPHSLISVFTVRFIHVGIRRYNVSSCGQQRLWSDWAMFLLGTQVILLILSCSGSNFKDKKAILVITIMYKKFLISKENRMPNETDMRDFRGDLPIHLLYVIGCIRW